MSDPVVIRGLGHRFGELVVVEDISFQVETGGFTSIVGPTGCGKSTILRALAGLVRPTVGTVEIEGRSATDNPGSAAYMPQGDTLLPWRRALANATLGAQIRHVNRQGVDGDARRLFARFGLAGFEDAWPAALSGGMRQRVSLLRTVLTGHSVLLLDEPFAALDAITRTDLQGWLADLVADEARTSVLVTHDVDEALRLSDEVIVLSDRPGRILAKITLDVPRPRRPERVTDPDLAMVKRRILGILDSGSR